MIELLKQYIPYPLIKAHRNVLRRWESRKLKGDKVLCPICNSRFEKFATYRPSGRKNTRCINCRSLPRHRLLYFYLQQRTNIFNRGQKLRVLHFAPEFQFYTLLAKQPDLEYTTCDLSPKSPDFREVKDIKKADITQLSFADNSFDVILCNHVLEHITDDRQAMRELYRVMAPGGWGIFMVPLIFRNEETYEDPSITKPSERRKAFGQYDHVRRYGRDYLDRLRSAGFEVTADRYAENFMEHDIQRFGFNPYDRIVLCKKQ
ncbi:class I SAM-dependent methyltransferase [Mucilaginibacter jinjuensis]|uniref:Methyltransferase domain-containing protein n=1 Tax=Mucilaginibacter jinjuensis TaxID=1176721 RepID=A0ABY7T7Z9_9SPHI|nr:class I SAM-dependent methyltransferase [Mucilaginibacter jinjuensis]WCT11991.1 methyltransferase domain-containing protein [Mucilaginibacter jinjuensis]